MLPKYSRYESAPVERRVFQIMDAAWSVKSSARVPPRLFANRASGWGAQGNVRVARTAHRIAAAPPNRATVETKSSFT